MITGITIAGIASRSFTQRWRIGTRGSTTPPQRSAMTYDTAIMPAAPSRPGMIPAMNNRLVEIPVSDA